MLFIINLLIAIISKVLFLVVVQVYETLVTPNSVAGIIGWIVGVVAGLITIWEALTRKKS